MTDNLFESYNPLYDVHLRQYFALPHMQKHLRDVGLLEEQGGNVATAADSAVYAHHQQMMELLLRNRERVLAQMADLHKKLDAAEKVEICRRIRSGLPIHIDEEDAAYATRRGGHVSRSLSRPSRGRSRRSRTGDATRQRRRSTSVDDSNELIKRIEADYRSDTEAMKNPQNIYNRLAASVYKYQYLHKMDDRTLANYKESLRKQLQKLERFRELSFGPNSVAKHQPLAGQQTASWFFRRRSLPSLETTTAAAASSGGGGGGGAAARQRTKPRHQLTNLHQPNKMHHQSLLMRSLRKTRGGKSQSPRASASEAPPKNRYGASRSRASYRQPRQTADQENRGLPPLSRRAAAPAQKQTAPLTKTPAKPAKLPPPTATVKPTIHHKQTKTTTKVANGKVPKGKSIEQKTTTVLPEIEQLKVTEAEAMNKPQISPGSSIATSSAPDADGEETESRNSVDSALANANDDLGVAGTATYNSAAEDDERDYSSRSSTSAYADSLNEDTPMSGGTATETRPTPEPGLESIDIDAEQKPMTLSRSESAASLKTLNNAIGVNEANGVTETPVAEKPMDITQINLNNEAHEADISAEHDQVQQHDRYKRDLDGEANREIYETQNIYLSTALSTEQIQAQEKDRSPDAEQNIADLKISTTEFIETTPPSTPPVSANREAEITAPVEEVAKHEMPENARSQPEVNTCSNEHKNVKSTEPEVQNFEAEIPANLEQSHDPTHNKFEEPQLDENIETGKIENSYYTHDTRVEETPNISSCNGADVSQLYEADVEHENQKIEQEPETMIKEEVPVFEHYETEAEVLQKEPEIQEVLKREPEIQHETFKPNADGYISDEDGTVENTEEMREEIGEYLQDNKSAAMNDRIESHATSQTYVIPEVEQLIEAEEYGNHYTENKLDDNDNLISSVYEKEYDNRESRPDVQFDKYDVGEKEFLQHDNKERNESVIEPQEQFIQSNESNEQFDEKLQHELRNLEATENLETNENELSMKKDVFSHHRFPSTPQNSFCHLDEIDINSAVKNHSENFNESKEMVKTEDENQKIVLGDYGTDESVQQIEGSETHTEVDAHELVPDSDNEHAQIDVSGQHVSADQELYSCNLEDGTCTLRQVENASPVKYDPVSDDRHDNQRDDELVCKREETNVMDDKYLQGTEGRNEDHLTSSTYQSDQQHEHLTDSTHQWDQHQDQIDDQERNQEYGDRLHAEKMLVDDEDLIKEGKGEITTFDGETRHYDHRSSKHLSHDDVSFHEEEVLESDVNRNFPQHENTITEDLSNDNAHEYQQYQDHDAELVQSNKDNQPNHGTDEPEHVKNFQREGGDIFQQSLHSEDAPNNNITSDSEWQRQDEHEHIDDDAHRQAEQHQRRHEDIFDHSPQYDRRDDDYENETTNEIEQNANATPTYPIHSEPSTEAIDKHESQQDADQTEQNDQESETAEPTCNDITKTHGDYHENGAKNIMHQPQFLTQPSIEITPASDYGGSMEHVDRISDAKTPDTSVPTTPKTPNTPNTESGSEVQEYSSYTNSDNGNDASVQQISYSNGQKIYDESTNHVDHYDNKTDDEDECNENSKLISHDPETTDYRQPAYHHNNYDHYDYEQHPRLIPSQNDYSLQYDQQTEHGAIHQNSHDKLVLDDNHDLYSATTAEYDKANNNGCDDDDDTGSVVIHDGQKSSDDEHSQPFHEKNQTKPEFYGSKSYDEPTNTLSKVNRDVMSMDQSALDHPNEHTNY